MSEQTDARLGELADDLLSQLAPPRPLSPDQVGRIRANISDDSARPKLRLAVIGAAAIVLCASSALAMYGVPVFAPVQAVEQPTPPTPQADEAAPRPSMQIPQPRSSTGAEDNAPNRAETDVEDVSPPTERAPTRPQTAAAPSDGKRDRARDAASVARETSLGAESRLLTLALTQLRKDRDAKAALATLDRYAAQFKRGALAAEARAARVEALLAAGDRRTALALLDANAASAELAVVRGELRLEAGRAKDALQDFSSALSGTDDALEARALYGRAASRIRLGDHDGGRGDLEEYLRRFPNGRSAADARTALGRSR
jgi:hypothetical protein